MTNVKAGLKTSAKAKTYTTQEHAMTRDAHQTHASAQYSKTQEKSKTVYSAVKTENAQILNAPKTLNAEQTT